MDNPFTFRSKLETIGHIEIIYPVFEKVRDTTLLCDFFTEKLVNKLVTSKKINHHFPGGV